MPPPTSENPVLIDAAQVSNILKMFQKVRYSFLHFIVRVATQCSLHVINDLGHVM